MKIEYVVYHKDTKEIIYDNFDSYLDAITCASYHPDRVATNTKAGLKNRDLQAYLLADIPDPI